MGNSRRPGSCGVAGHWDPLSPRTPGILGINDGADPNYVGLLGDSPGPLGLNDHADFSLCLQLESPFDFIAAPDPNADGVTLDQLTEIVGRSAATNALDQVNQAMRVGNVNTPARKAAFLAQVAEESAGLTKLDEAGSDAYFTRMYEPGTNAGDNVGNTIDGDGKKFKGRGLIQLTGRENYTRAWLYHKWPVTKDMTNDDFYQHVEPVDPSLAARPEYSSKIAGWYWDVLKHVNATADKLEKSTDEKATFIQVTKKINGATNGLAQRIEYYKLAKKALGITWGTLHWAPKPPHVPKPKKKARPAKAPKKPSATVAPKVEPPKNTGRRDLS